MKLIKILSDKIQIRTDQQEFSNVRINDLISISDGTAELITMVTSVTDNDSDSGIGEDDFIFERSSVKVVECSIIGSVRGGKFSKALDQYPTTDITAREVTSEEFAELIGQPESGFHIGTYAAYACPAWVDGNRFFQRHSCIVGNTGSGKSETVAKILEETSKLPGANIIVFDIHGEYRELSYARNISFSSAMPFPIWMFGFSDMVSNILKIKGETATVAMSALRKVYNLICAEGNEGKPVYFKYEKLIEGLKLLNEEQVPTGEFYKTGASAGQQKMVKGEYNGRLHSIISTLESKENDARLSFLFQEADQSYLEELVLQILGNDKPVKNIDLSNMPHDIAIAVIGAVTKLIYGVQQTFKDGEITPVTLVCDEAHVYIPNSLQLSASERRMVEIFENIAKEGRKFGMTLFVASQRPSELNKTIMAQCANFIVSKLNNETDKSMVKGMLPDGNEDIIDSTTTFSPGEVLIIGDAVPIPLKIKVELATERPQSRTIDFWDSWKKGTKADLVSGIERYMNS